MNKEPEPEKNYILKEISESEKKDEPQSTILNIRKNSKKPKKIIKPKKIKKREKIKKNKKMIIFQGTFLLIFLFFYIVNYFVHGSRIGFFGVNAFFTNINLFISLLFQLFLFLEEVFPNLKQGRGKYKSFIHKLLALCFTFTGFIFPLYWPFMSYVDFSNFPKACPSTFKHIFCIGYSVAAHFLVVIPPWHRIIYNVVLYSWTDIYYPLAIMLFYFFFLLYWSITYWSPYQPADFIQLWTYTLGITVLVLIILSFWIGKIVAGKERCKKKSKEIKEKKTKDKKKNKN